jgi:hypothetical protein
VRYVLQTLVALALLVGLPVFVKAPASTEGMVAAGAGALVLVALAVHGAISYVRSRKPRAYLDSVIPPLDPPRK